MEEFINKQFIDQFRDFGLEKPWYWDQLLNEMNWVHHAYHLGVWFWRPICWWNPVGGSRRRSGTWLEEKYPGWNDSFGRYWDVIGENVRPTRTPRLDARDLPDRVQQAAGPGLHARRATPAATSTARCPASSTRGRRVTRSARACQWVFRAGARAVRRPPVDHRPAAGRHHPAADHRGCAARLWLGPGPRRWPDGTDYALRTRPPALGGPWPLFPVQGIGEGDFVVVLVLSSTTPT